MKRRISEYAFLAFFVTILFSGNNIAKADTCTPACGAGETCAAGLCLASGHGTPTSAPVPFTNPLDFKSVEDFLNHSLGVMQGIIVLLALVAIVIGAIIYVTSAGNSGQIETAKKAITSAMIGLALAIAAPSILKEVGNAVGWGGVNSSVVAGSKTFSQIAANVLNFLLGIFGILAIIMMVIGGIMYLTSAGDEERIKTGKNIFKYALLGTFFALAAMVLTRQIALLFS